MPEINIIKCRETESNIKNRYELDLKENAAHPVSPTNPYMTISFLMPKWICASKQRECGIDDNHDHTVCNETVLITNHRYKKKETVKTHSYKMSVTSLSEASQLQSTVV